MEKLILGLIILVLCYGVGFSAANDIFINYPCDSGATHDTYTTPITISGIVAASIGLDDTVTIHNGGVTQSVVSINADSTWSGTSTVTIEGDMVYATLETGDETSFIGVDYYGTPNIVIDTPTTGTDTNETLITVAGTIAEATTGDTIEIYTNTTLNTTCSVLAYNGGFSGTATLSDYGDNIIVILHDQFGRHAYDTIIVNYFGTPDIAITSPDTGYDTIVSVITISGTTENSDAGDTVRIHIGGVTHSTYTLLTYDGTWSGTIALTKNLQSVSVVFHSSNFGTQDTYTITLSYFGTPSFAITYPSTTSHDTSKSEITIGGSSYNTNTGDAVISIFVSSYDDPSKTLTEFQSSYTTTADSDNWSGTTYLKYPTQYIVAKMVVGNLYDTTLWDTIVVYSYDSNYLKKSKKAKEEEVLNSVLFDKYDNATSKFYKSLNITSPAAEQYYRQSVDENGDVTTYSYDSTLNLLTKVVETDIYYCTKTFVWTTSGSDSILVSKTVTKTYK